MDDLDLGATLKAFIPGQKVFNRYTLIQILGRGGMGVVWRARDDRLERDVALKFLPEVMMGDKLALTELKRETRRSLDLTHSHIVRIYDFVEDAHTAAIAMEYIAGDTLTNARVKRPGHCYDPEDLKAWVGQLCSALEYAHTRAKVVHRDLKPANLMIDAAGDLKVTDFGIASSIADSVSRVSRDVGSSGTPVYMSPQQMMGDKPAVADDVYALGATLYDLLTGKPPFYSGNIIIQVQNKVPPSLASRRAELEVAGAPIPPEWEQTIAACLAKEPSDRPRSAVEVAERLELAASPHGEPAFAKVATGTHPDSEVRERPVPRVPDAGQTSGSAPRRSAAKAPLYAGLAAGVIVLGLAGWYFGLRLPEQKRLAEIARLEAAGRELEAARLRTEQERYAVEARERAERERREAERLAAARGGIVVRTMPVGAEVRVGAVALERSPLTLKDQKLGRYPVRIRLEGYEDWNGEVEVKENEFTDLDVALVRSTGLLSLTSEPAGLEAEIRGRTSGVDSQTVRAPTDIKLPTGSYEVIFRQSGWPEQVRNVEIGRNTQVAVTADFSPGQLMVTSTPNGAEVVLGGRVVGRTPLTVSEVIPGLQSAELRLSGYKPQTVSGTVTAREVLRLGAMLEEESEYLPLLGTWICDDAQRKIVLRSSERGIQVQAFHRDGSALRVSGVSQSGGSLEWTTHYQSGVATHFVTEALEGGKLPVRWNIRSGATGSGRNLYTRE